MFVGGEFYDDSIWITGSPSPPVEGVYFLNGGRACLSVISQYLYSVGVRRMLLPSYLCPSILDVLDQHGVTYEFYRVNEDFSIDLEDLSRKANEHKAIYFINYFGFLHSPDTLSVFLEMQRKGSWIIEDNAQACTFENPLGDFVFNSMRKVCACDGGYVATRIYLFEVLENMPALQNRRLPVVREYRRQLADYLFKNRGNRAQLDALFLQAEALYADGVIRGDAGEKEKIESLDWPAIKSVRRENYQFLLGRIADIPRVRPLFPVLQAGIMPMGLPVYLEGVSRDLVNEALSEASISLSIHWDDLLHDPRTNQDPLVVKMAGSVLTLAIDQYTSRSQLEYQADNLARILATLKT